MRIRRLKLTGFKSFVEPAELRIEPGLTGVVGPNGCGKSNVLEAIRWVMGESSPKSMRGAGMDDVIFAGTGTRPARDFAEVSLLVERRDDEVPGDTGPAMGGEVEVTRRIERGAGSAYRINGRDVRAKDVALLFADAATGAHSPALVSQGRISAVIAARPTERRMMLEEAAGIAGLHVRRKDAEQKLRAAEANLTRLDEVLGDMEQRAQALRRQAKAAERYRALSDRIKVAEARLIFARWREADAAAVQARDEAERAGAAVEAAAEAQRGAAAYRQQADEALAARRSEAQAARDTAAALGHRLAALNAERDAAARRIGELADLRAALAVDDARERQLADDAETAIARLATEIEAIAARIAAAEEGRGTIDVRTVAAEDAAREADAALGQARAAQAGEQAEARVAAAALQAAHAQAERMEAEVARLRTQIDTLEDESILVAARDQAAARRDDALARRSAAAEALRAAEAEREAAAALRDEAETEAAAARAALAALQSEAKALREAATGAAGSRAIDHVRAAPGYERALAAALGDDLDAALGTEGTRRWQGAPPEPGDPRLPADVASLADHVVAPAALARRLAQVAVVDEDDGALTLAVGQRLVTRNGSLRRWDGYAATGLGAAAAERLIRANRLADLDAALPGAAASEAAAAQRIDAARERMEGVRDAIAGAREIEEQAAAAIRDAGREEDAASLAIERRELQRVGLDERAGQADAERARARKALDDAEAAAAALPDAAATEAGVARLRVQAQTAQAALAEIRAEAATRAQAIGADRRRADAAEKEQADWQRRAVDAARRRAEVDGRAAAAAADAEAMADAPARLATDADAMAADARAAAEAAEAAAADERQAEAQVRDTERRAAEVGEALSVAREARAGAGARAESHEARRAEMARTSGERFECLPPLLPERAGFVADDVGEAPPEAAALDRLSAERERIGPVNLVAERELSELDEGRLASQAEREELGLAINRLRGSIGSLNREGRVRLLAAFEEVDRHFRSLFTTLFDGGQAHLELIESDDPLEAGLEIMAQPPGKKLSALTLLSGGEQALTAVALIFALFLTNPAPICVLDEVDAPLDDANIERFCDLLDRMTAETDTRYLIVTHNAVTMSRMHRLFGVTMIEKGVSRLVSVDLGGAEKLLAAE